MSISIEQSVKKQFAKFFEAYDWKMFKESADYYFEFAAKLLNSDILHCKERHKLWRRNATKRLYLGIGAELLLKSVYLKNKYCINTPKRGKLNPRLYPFKFIGINKQDFKTDNTLTLNQLIEKLLNIEDAYNHPEKVLKGLKIAKVFRNKEGHVSLYRHDFVPQNYTDIEVSLADIYKTSFSETLDIKISFADGDEFKFKIK